MAAAVRLTERLAALPGRCPVDFKTAGMIIDDELNALLCNPLPPGVSELPPALHRPQSYCTRPTWDEQAAPCLKQASAACCPVMVPCLVA